MTKRRVQIVLFLTAMVAGAMQALGGPLVEKVTGEGRVQQSAENFGSYAVSIGVAAFEDEDGRVWGTVTGQVYGTCYISNSGGPPCAFTANISCLDILVDEVWIYAVVATVDQSSCGSYSPGAPIVVYIRDRGTSGADLMKLADPADSCSSSTCGSFVDFTYCCLFSVGGPGIPVIESGDFKVHSRSSKPEQPASIGTWSMVKRLYQE